MLQANVRAAVRGTGVPAELTLREGVLVLRVARDGLTPAEHAAAVDRVAERAADVPGIVRVCRALRVDKTPEAAIAASVALTDAGSGAFAVRSRRRDKRFPVTSEQLNALIGARDRGRARAAGVPQAPGHGDLRRGRPARGVRVHGRAARAGRPAGGDERPRGRADVRRHRLARRRLPDDEARAALRLPALFRDAADRTRVGLQGLRAGPRARPVPGRVAAVRGAVRQGAAVPRHLGGGPPPGHGAAAADAQDSGGPRRRGCTPRPW